MSRALVLSEPRFIGPAVVECLLSAGWHVVWVCNETPELEHDALDVRVAPRSAVGQIVSELGPLDGVVDVDAWTGDDARHLIDALTPAPPTVAVVLSSINVYRAFESLLADRISDAVPLTEEAALRTRSKVYAEVDPTRASLEHLDVEAAWSDAAALPTCVLRLPVVYGPGDTRRREWPWVRRVLDRKTVLPMARGWMGWTISRAYVGDVARAVALALEQPEAAAGQVFNVGEADCLPWAALAQAVSRAAGAEVEVVAVQAEDLPPHLDPGPHTPQPVVVDTRRIRDVLGYEEARSREENLAEAVRWHLDHPPEIEDIDDLPDYAAEDRLLSRLGYDPNPTEPQ